MSQNQEKPWERPWTTKEMIENASNWNLAGDAGLLRYLEDFSDKMLSKVKDTNDRLNDLVDSATETSLALSNVTNKFMGLRNTQFIESRVYEDDETLPTKSKVEKEIQPSKQTEAERLEEMKQAILNGLGIIDEYYEKVEIPESDSEEETNGASIMYRPVDPYMDRPLPYVIGTDEWHKYWHVGLAHSSSESEIENEQYSESESEQEEDLPVRDRSQIPGISDSESEELPKHKIPQPLPRASAIDKSDKNMFDSSSESDAGSLPPQINTVNNSFAEELAAKLVKVEAVVDTEVNTKPIKPTKNITAGLFSDEPPPLEEDDMFSNKNTKSDLFSGGLFDDMDGDSDFWNTKAPITKKAASVTVLKKKADLFSGGSEDENDIFSDNKKKEDSSIVSKQRVNQPKKSTGLFDDDDDDIFSSVSLPQPKKSILPPYKTSVPLISNEPPELEPPLPKIASNVEPQSKKPVGGVLVLGVSTSINKDIEKILKNRVPSTDSESEKEPTTTPQVNVQTQKDESKPTPNKNNITSLFDDTSPLFTDDIFSSVTTKKFTSGLFDTEPPELNDELFKQNVKKEIPKKEIPKKETPKMDESKEKLINITQKVKMDTTKPTLFSSEPPPLTPKVKDVSLFDDSDDFDDSLFKSIPKTLLKPQDVETRTSTKKLVSGLFDDDVEDSLFSSGGKEKSHTLFDPNPPDIITTNNEKQIFQHAGLFDSNPPELDESDNKSESQSQLSLESESSNFGIMSSSRATLFDSEPPLLPSDSEIMKSQFMASSEVGE